MAGDIVAALAARRKKALRSKASNWLDRGTCVLHTRNGNIDPYSYCQCKPTTKVQQVAVQGREDQGHTSPFVVGRVVGAGDGTCVAKEVSKRQTIDGTPYDVGDYVISVQW